MFEYRSIHAAATDKVARLTAETAERGALAVAHRGESTPVRRTVTLFWALRLLTC